MLKLFNGDGTGQAPITAMHDFGNVKEPHTDTFMEPQQKEYRPEMQWITILRPCMHTHTHAHAHTQHSTIRAGVVGTHHHRSHGTQARLLPPERMRSCAHLRLCEKLLKYLFDEISASNSVGGCSLNNDDVHLRDKRFPIVNKSEFSLRFITKLFFIVYEVRIFLGRTQK